MPLAFFSYVLIQVRIPDFFSYVLIQVRIPDFFSCVLIQVRIPDFCYLYYNIRLSLCQFSILSGQPNGLHKKLHNMNDCGEAPKLLYCNQTPL